MSAKPEGHSPKDLLSSNFSADVTKNVFYWTRVAIVVAQGAGMHRRCVWPERNSDFG